MQAIFQSMQQTLNSSQALHAATVHLPIAAAVFGVLLLIALLLSAGKNDGLRWATILVFALGAAAGFFAMESGEDAMRQLSPVAHELSDAASQDLEQHEEMGEKVWGLLALTAGLVALSALKRPWVRITALSLASVAAVTTLIWVGVTAHHGGQLVYRHGAGVPDSPNNNVSETSTAPAISPTTRPADPE